MKREWQTTMKKSGDAGAPTVAGTLLTPDEVAAVLKVTVRTVERWQQEGVLPFLRLGHAVRFYWPAVLEHLLAHCTVCHAGRGTLRPDGLNNQVTKAQRSERTAATKIKS
jgi:excisionase family DNA binding protein